MSDNTGIEWTDATWNPVVGCSVISPGCTNCYAMKLAGRLEAMGSPVYKGHTVKTKAGFVWNGKVSESNWGQMIKPLSWKAPRHIFANSMSDLFHADMPEETIDRVFAVMALTQRHTYQVLTKRPDRMRAEIRRIGKSIDILERHARDIGYTLKFAGHGLVKWPLPNVWLGTSVEDADRKPRIDILREVPAAVRFLSLEPLLADLGTLDLRDIGWVIVGGESGSGWRPVDLDWVRSIRDQCHAAGVPFFFKQHAGHKPKKLGRLLDGREWNEVPKP